MCLKRHMITFLSYEPLELFSDLFLLHLKTLLSYRGLNKLFLLPAPACQSVLAVCMAGDSPVTVRGPSVTAWKGEFLPLGAALA